MADVVAEIRAYPLHTSEGAYPAWGPAPQTLGDAVFPAGSRLLFQKTTQLSRPDTQDTSGSLLAYSAAVAAGGNGASAPCGNPANHTRTPVATLEQLVERHPGRPCVFQGNTQTGNRNEWWSNSTLSLGPDVDGPVPALPHYRQAQPTRSLRLGFPGGDAVNYYDCAIRASDGSIRNCDAIGSGRYTIAAQGDARVMRFSGLPARQAARLDLDRLFVERSGAVHWGWREKPQVINEARLNAEATDALFARLGLAR